MSHSRTYDKTKPVDTDLQGDGDNLIRNLLEDLFERLVLDHNFEGILDTSLSTADGYHRQVTLKNMTSDPAILTGGSVIYSKSDGLYFRNSAGIIKIA